jgi:LPXTG-site transpeptidase (sortase) family protein
VIADATARRAAALLLCVGIAALTSQGLAGAATCPPPRSNPPSPDCRAGIPALSGYPTQGLTCTVHPGIPYPDVVQLPGGAVLCAGGETAWPYGKPHAHGRAIFRISGSGPGGPGGLSIVVSASSSDNSLAPELLPGLFADALVALPPGTVLLRFDPASGAFRPVHDGRLRLAGLYKIVRRGNPPMPAPLPAATPALLPATGESPFAGLLLLAGGAIVVGLALGGAWWRPQRRARPTRSVSAHERAGALVLALGLALACSTAVSFAYFQSSGSPAGFGAFARQGGPAPLGRLAGAGGSPSRLAIPRLGIDTPVITLDVANGAWQVPSYAAGYLAGSAGVGQAGNVAIAGHDDGDGSVFRRLGELAPGDDVLVYAKGRAYRYRVFALRTVAPNRTDLIRPTREPVLTLITCAPYLIDNRRLVAQARLVAGG